MREVVVLVAIGIVIGLGAAMTLTRYVRSQLFGLSAMDPITPGVAILGLGVVACVASIIQADRASRVDAIRALRYE